MRSQLLMIGLTLTALFTCERLWSSPCTRALRQVSTATSADEVSRLMSAIGWGEVFSGWSEQQKTKTRKIWKNWTQSNQLSNVQMDALALQLLELKSGSDYSFVLSVRLSSEDLLTRIQQFWENYAVLRAELERLARSENKKIHDRFRDRVRHKLQSAQFQSLATLVLNAGSLTALGLPSYLPHLSVSPDASARTRFLHYQYQRVRRFFFITLAVSLGMSAWITGAAQIEAQALEQFIQQQQRLAVFQRSLAPDSPAPEKPPTRAIDDLYESWIKDFRSRHGREPQASDVEYQLMKDLLIKSDAENSNSR